jgi:hypothetical protein
MKSSAFVFLFATACGPAFQSDLFKGERDAGNIVAVSDASKLDATSTEADVLDIDSGPSPLHSDASSEVYDADVEVEACSCAELCSGAYPLRACESCYLETCPTWEGGLPE